MGLYRFIGKKEGNYLILTDDELKHAKVRRINIGENIEVNTLDGNVYIGRVEEISKKFLKAKVLEKLKINDDNDLHIELFLAVPNRPSKIDDLIEPLSELGVTKLIPVISTFTAVKLKDVQKKLEKWKKIALNSIKQCKRLYPMEIENPIKVSEINTNAELKFVFYEKEKYKKLKDFLGKNVKKVAIYIGNEGGISDEDFNELTKKGFISVTLSKNILRMETAVISAVCQTIYTFS